MTKRWEFDPTNKSYGGRLDYNWWKEQDIIIPSIQWPMQGRVTHFQGSGGLRIDKRFKARQSDNCVLEYGVIKPSG